MTHIPCNLRKFPLQVNRLTYLEGYLRWMKHLSERIGLQNSLEVWNTTFSKYDIRPIQSFLSIGWNQITNPDPNIEDKIKAKYVEFFSPIVDENLFNQMVFTIENTPPIKQIREYFNNGTYEKEISAYDALLLRFDGQASLAENMIIQYGKQGEFIVYDIMIESRLASTNGQTGTIEEFINDFTKLPEGKNLFSSGLEIQVIEKSQQNAIVYVHECEWARYFNDHHPNVGYLLACSTDEVAYKAFNKRINMVRTETLMEGSNKCDFRIFPSQKIE